jgi:hypothetical protein
MGSEMRKAQCTTLYVCDSIKEKRIKNALIDPGRTFLLNPEDLRIMSTAKNEYTMDDFSMLTI